MRTDHWVEFQEGDVGMVIMTFVDGERSMTRNVSHSIWQDFVRPQLERTCEIIDEGPRVWWFMERNDAD